MKVAIYKITNKINDKAYIGITTKTTKTRFAEHIYSSENGGKYRINYAIRKYGKENFGIETIMIADNKEQALLIETENIIKYDSWSNGYNMNEGGTGILYHTKVSKKKMSENNYWRGKNRSGANNPMYGKHHTEESKKQMSEKKIGVFAGEKHYLFGKHHSEETKEKIRQKAVGRPSARKGKKHSEESKKLMSESKKGKMVGINNPMYGKRHSEETKEKMRKPKHLGCLPSKGNLHHSEETKEKMRQKALGRPSQRKGVILSEEIKRKMSESKKGKVSYTKNWLVTFPDNHQEEIDNMAEFCRKYTLNRGNMSSVASGKLNHYKKYKIIRI